MTPAALEWVARFRRYLSSERRLSAHTDVSYARDLAALVKYCDRAGLAHWGDLDTQHVRTFAAHSHAGGLAPRSIQRRLSAVRSFYTFLLRERAGAPAGAWAKLPVARLRAAASEAIAIDFDMTCHLLKGLLRALTPGVINAGHSMRARA